MTAEDTRRVAEIVGNHRFGMLTTRDPFGSMVSRPMAMQEVEFDGDLWFFAERGSRKIDHIGAHPQVNVAMSSDDSWVSLTGEAAVVDEVARKRELWNGGVEAWLPQGPDDDGVVLIRVESTSAEYWDTPGGRIATAISFAKAKLTGQRFEGGDNERVDL
jgi:general stress protein 26